MLDMLDFLDTYCSEHGILPDNCKRWGGDRRNALEAAIVAHFGPGSYTTSDAIKAIKQMLLEH